mmetsp:Transcript_15656/g.29598  ORF Transcript_15656/g.29598 Transcript_15656/m.29598 type:complete len:333 (-) Transcript_15656:132-1130(-)
MTRSSSRPTVCLFILLLYSVSLVGASAFLSENARTTALPSQTHQRRRLHRRNPPSLSRHYLLSHHDASKSSSTSFNVSTAKHSSTTDGEDQILDPRFLQRNQYWVVLVDDEEAIRLAVGDYLYDEGYQVTACAEAAALLEDVLPRDGMSRLPDVIISDIRMPTTDGLQLLTKIRQNPLWARIPVVLLTAKGLTTDRVAGYKAGADAYLTKPFDPEELLSMLDNIILRRRQLQANTASGLVDLQQELAGIKQLMQENTQRVVKATTVYLTDTERTVLQAVCDGLTNAEIAQSFDLSADKVSRTISKLYRATQCQTRTELVRWAFSTGYASPYT